MSEIQATLSKYPIKTRLSLSGTLIVARDIAHAKLKERLDNGQGLPQYAKDHIIYYAGTFLLSLPTNTLVHDATANVLRPHRPRQDA
jgi:tartrate dehydratase beta subunit/fumarate hydratase class I family protein